MTPAITHLPVLPCWVQDANPVGATHLARRARALLERVREFRGFFQLSQSLFSAPDEDDLAIIHNAFSLGTSLCCLHNLLPRSMRSSSLEYHMHLDEAVVLERGETYTRRFLTAVQEAELFQGVRISDICHTPPEADHERLGKVNITR